MSAILHLFLIFSVLIIFNELLRRSRLLILFLFGLVPLLLTFLVWPNTTGPQTSVNTWFHWAKVYSVLAACLGFSLIRFSRFSGNTLLKIFPPLILAVNILEAVIRDFELFSTAGGGWHILNGIAGVCSILALSGWLGIHSDRENKKDLLWPDMTLLWIIAYDVWNLAYIWFCVPEHAFYGIAVLAACTIPSVFIKKGTWIQARAYTLGIWMIYIMTFNRFADTPGVFMMLPSSKIVLWSVGVLSLVLNSILVIKHFVRIRSIGEFRPGKELYAA